ncbi:MAG: OsmC family protein [Candidatus Latescibacterota bacterium]|jgi:uncharacterized OsmC-like protein
METIEKRNIKNGVDLIVLGATVAAMKDDAGLGHAKFRVNNAWIDGNRNVSKITGFYGAREEISHSQEFSINADEPPVLAGSDTAPNPVEILLSALASCLTTSLVAHASVNGIEIGSVESEIEGDLDLNGFLGLDPSVAKGFTDIRVKIHVDADDDNVAKLRRLALFSPVYNTLTSDVNVSVNIDAQR